MPNASTVMGCSVYQLEGDFLALTEVIPILMDHYLDYLLSLWLIEDTKKLAEAPIQLRILYSPSESTASLLVKI